MRQHLLISSCESVIHAFRLAHLRVFQSYFFILPKTFSENSRTADYKTIPFQSFQPFLAEKMAPVVEKARFNPFVLPSDFFKSDGDLA